MYILGWWEVCNNFYFVWVNFNSIRTNNMSQELDLRGAEETLGLRLSVTLASNRRLRTPSSLSSCWCWSLPWTRTSSMLHSTPSKPNMIFWNFSEPERIPKGNTLKQNCPHGVMNVVKGFDSQANLICQNPEFASSLVKTVEPTNFLTSCLLLGEGDSPA